MAILGVVRKGRRLATATAWLVTLLEVFAPGPTWADLPATVSRVKPSVVGVGTYQVARTPRGQLQGTGFAVGDGRHVLTNAHVVTRNLGAAGQESLAVFVGRGTRPEVRKAKKVALDPDHDLALLRISGGPLPALELGNSDAVREGERFAFTGFPIGAVLGLYPATHRGIVSAITPIARPMDRAGQLTAKTIRRLEKPYRVFQLDATAYPGNSGSPLYAPDTGRVIGIVNMVFVKDTKETVLQEPSGISYAIPIQYAYPLLERAGLGN